MRELPTLHQSGPGSLRIEDRNKAKAAVRVWQQPNYLETADNQLVTDPEPENCGRFACDMGFLSK